MMLRKQGTSLKSFLKMPVRRRFLGGPASRSVLLPDLSSTTWGRKGEQTDSDLPYVHSAALSPLEDQGPRAMQGFLLSYQENSLRARDSQAHSSLEVLQ